jgi:hypothetical protein
MDLMSGRLLSRVKLLSRNDEKSFDDVPTFDGDALQLLLSMNHWLYRYLSTNNVIKTMFGSKGGIWMTMKDAAATGLFRPTYYHWE